MDGRAKLATLIVISALAPGAPRAAESAPAVHVRTLRSGLRVVALPRRGGGGALACSVVIRGGSAGDPAGMAGASALLARLLENGTDRLGVADPEREKEARRSVENFEVTYQSFYREALEELRRGEGSDPADPAARAPSLTKLRDVLATLEQRHRRELIFGELRNIYHRAGASGARWDAGPDAIRFDITIPSDRAELFFACEAERLGQAVLRGIPSARDDVRREWLERAGADDALILKDRFRRALWAGHPYGAPEPGAEPLDAAPIERLEREKQQLLRPSNISLILAGDIAPERAFELAENYFNFLAPAPARDETYSPPPASPGRLRVEGDARANASVTFAWRTPPAAHRDAAALAVLAEMAGERAGAALAADAANGAASNLQIIGAEARADLGRLGGTFTIAARTQQNQSLPSIETRLAAAAQSLRAAAASPGELARAKGRALAKQAAVFDTIQTLAAAAARAEACGALPSVADLPGRIATLTSEELLAVARARLGAAPDGILIIHRTRAAPPPKAAPPPPAPVPPAPPPRPPSTRRRRGPRM